MVQIKQIQPRLQQLQLAESMKGMQPLIAGMAPLMQQAQGLYYGGLTGEDQGMTGQTAVGPESGSRMQAPSETAQGINKDSSRND